MLLEPARFHRPPDREPIELIAEAWGATRTWALPQRRQADVAACLALHAARGRQVVVQRDVDAATVAGLVVAGVEPHWLRPEIDPVAGVAHGVTPESLDAALTAAPGARAAIVVAPTFHGAVPDIALLAAVAHGHGAALVVDEAWGAHLPFHPDLPVHAIAAGAALVLTRLGTATLLHQGRHAERWLPAATIDRAVRLCGPGEVAASALPATPALASTLRAVAAARAQLTGLPGVRVLGPELAGEPGAAGFDPLRLTVDLLETGRDARAVAEALRERAAIEPALATARHLVLALDHDDGELGRAERFAAALLASLWTVPPADGGGGSLPSAPHGPALCTPRAAWLGPQERVAPEAAVGRIATETLTPYPPGVPAVLPGDCLVPDVVATLRALVAAGGVVEGTPDGLETFGVIAGSPARGRWAG